MPTSPRPTLARLVLALAPLVGLAPPPAQASASQEDVPDAHREQPFTLTIGADGEPGTLLLRAPRTGRLSIWAESRTQGVFLRLRAHAGPTRDAPAFAEAEADSADTKPWISPDVDAGQPILVSVQALTAVQGAALVDVFARTTTEPPDSTAIVRNTEQRLRGIHALIELPDVEAARDEILRLVAELFALDPDARSGQVDQALGLIGNFYRARFDHRARMADLVDVFVHQVEFAEEHMPRDSDESLRRVVQLGRALRAGRRLSHSAEVFTSALQLASERYGEDHLTTLRMRAELAQTYSEQGDLRRVRTLSAENLALVEAREQPDPQLLRMVRFDLGRILFEGENFHAALPVLEQTLQTFRAAGVDEGTPEYQVALALVGECHLRLQDHRSARRYQEAFLAIADPSNFNTSLIEDVRWNLACSMTWLGDTHLARQIFEEYSDEEHAPNSGGGHVLYLTLAQLLLDAGEVEEARQRSGELLDAALARWGPDYELTLLTAVLHGDALLQSDDHEVAWRRLQALLDASEEVDRQGPDSVGARGVYEVLGRAAHRRGDHETAARMGTEIYASIDPAVRGIDPQSASALALQVHAFSALGRRPETELAVRGLCSWMRQVAERQALLSTPREARMEAARMEPWIEALLSAANAEELALDPMLEGQIFTAVEGARSLEYVTHRVQRRAARGAASEEIQAFRDQAFRATRRLAFAYESQAEASEVTRIVRERDRNLRLLSERLADSIVPTAPEPKRLSAGLRPGQAAIGYREARDPREGGRRVLVAWVLRDDGRLVRERLGLVAEVEQAVGSWRAATDDPRAKGGRARVREAGVALRRLVLDPLRPHLDAIDEVVVACDGAMHEVPFDALPGDSGDLLGSTLRFRRVPALAMLGNEVEDAPRADRDDRPAELFAIGGIDYGTRPKAGEHARAGFAPLPFTLREVETILSLWSSAQGPRSRSGSVLTGMRATRTRFAQEAPTATHLHVATHGSFVGRDEEAGSEAFAVMAPLLTTGLAFAHANREPDVDSAEPLGFLTAEELAQLDLDRCELAVLSACESSRGRTEAGQGAASLQTALHAAGVRSAITSLWPVDDAATAEMMERLYRHLVLGASPADALWSAKLEMRATQADERHWAGWVLSGLGR